MPISSAADWCVYLILCDNQAFYCGISKDAPKRFAAHCAGKGARYTRMHRPVSMRIIAEGLAQGDALAWEARLKKLNLVQKARWWAQGQEIGPNGHSTG